MLHILNRPVKRAKNEASTCFGVSLAKRIRTGSYEKANPNVSVTTPLAIKKTRSLMPKAKVHLIAKMKLNMRLIKLTMKKKLKSYLVSLCSK